MTREQMIKLFTKHNYFVSITYYSYGTSAIIRDANSIIVARLMGAGMSDEDLLRQFLRETQGFGLVDLQGGIGF